MRTETKLFVLLTPFFLFIWLVYGFWSDWEAVGTAALLQAPDPDTARAVLTSDRYADIEVHNWDFGGRPA